MASEYEWLSKLKAGDKVLLCSGGGWGGPNYQPAIVSAVGKRHFKIGSGHENKYIQQYAVKDGRKMGERYGYRLVPFDQSLLDAQAEELERCKLAGRVDAVRWRDLDHATLKAVAALVLKPTPEHP